MSLNVPNYLLCKILEKDEELYKIADRISQTKPSKELNSYVEMFINQVCKTVEKFFHKKFSLPKIEFSKYITDFYDASTNTICLNENTIRIPDLLHEFRHYLQCQFEEFSYFKGNFSPLPPPFYHFQLHEINAYNFQHRYEYSGDRDKVAELTEIFNDFKHLIKIGAFNPKAFKIEHEYYKDYNKLFDQMDMDLEILKTKFPNSKISEFKQHFYSQDIKVKHYKTNKNFFNLEFKINEHKYEANFEIKDEKCIIYGINICEDIRICKREEYEKACNLAFDFASNIAKLYKINELDIDPYSLNINKKDFKEIINNFKSKQVGIADNLEFNKIPNPMPKENIINDLNKNLNFNVESTKDYIDENEILENSEIEQEIKTFNMEISEER